MKNFQSLLETLFSMMFLTALFLVSQASGVRIGVIFLNKFGWTSDWAKIFLLIVVTMSSLFISMVVTRSTIEKAEEYLNDK